MEDIQLRSSTTSPLNGVTFTIGTGEDSAAGCDQGDPETLEEEIKNIKSVIRITTQKLVELNERFGKQQNPPSIYIQEYEGLTNRIHELQLREQLLQDKLGSDSLGESPSPTEEPHYEISTHTIGVDSGYDSTAFPYPNDSLLLASTPLVTPNSSSGNLLASPQMPRSPLRNMIKANLPNQQKTCIQVQDGLTLKEALAKPMKRRELVPENCVVYKMNSPHKVPWDTDCGLLAGLQLSVELKDHLPFPATTTISHNYVRKTFLTIVFCDICRRLLFQGFKCQTCGTRFHQKCLGKVGDCQPTDDIESLPERREQIKHLLAENVSAAGLLSPPTSHPRGGGSHPQAIPRRARSSAQIPQRERSTSAPNVSMNLVNAGDIPSLEELARNYSRADQCGIIVLKTRSDAFVAALACMLPGELSL
ncbi:hypothetical protein CAPTEDRAFT_217324 [Capitella teleta]|uniref:Phorbol-ester/DAG-type domain-containing protein n=2 Tax=Capitella teleta TaxID=283909 RepID=R7TUY1_CAPTE|nr:hypothetical protein CAPTEDRAFT_217324 [Capitella teleta]|eukprot:ELT97372.1 hypothetical protein CAPTEDRAFT_217324 [Capitella teleta]